MSKHAAIYVRISEDREGGGLGVKRQEADCREVAKRLGWAVAGVYIDNDLSAYTGRDRPGYEQLLEDLRTGTVDAVIAWHPDRLHRSPRELETFIDVCEARDVAIQTARAGTVDLATPSGRAVARTLGAWARFESEHKSERIRRKARELAEAGKIGGGGTRPFGYEPDRRRTRPPEAEHVREAARRLLAGESLRAIAGDWNARPVPTVTGTPWSASQLRNLMTSGRIAGWREHHRVLVAPAEWEAIIDRPTLDRLRALLLDPSRRTTYAGQPRRYLLTGLLRCSRCGTSLVGRAREDATRRYICPKGPGFAGCNGTAILAEPIEDLIRGAVLEAIETPELVQAVKDHARQSGAADELEQLRADEAALEQLARDHYADHLIGRAEYLAASQALNARVDATKRRLAHRNGTGVLEQVAGAGALAQAAWDERGIDWRRALIGATIEDVTIGPGRRGYNRFDPSRVEIRWRY